MLYICVAFIPVVSSYGKPEDVYFRVGFYGSAMCVASKHKMRLRVLENMSLPSRN